VQICTLLYCVAYKIVHCPAPAGAALAWRWRRAESLVLLRPIPAAAPRWFSSNAPPLWITVGRFTFQNRASCAEKVDLRRCAQRRRPPPAAAAQAASAHHCTTVAGGGDSITTEQWALFVLAPVVEDGFDKHACHSRIQRQDHLE